MRSEEKTILVMVICFILGIAVGFTLHKPPNPDYTLKMGGRIVKFTEPTTIEKVEPVNETAIKVYFTAAHSDPMFVGFYGYEIVRQRLGLNIGNPSKFTVIEDAVGGPWIIVFKEDRRWLNGEG